MSKFWCPTCDMWAHIEEDEDNNDPKLDRCWHCKTLVEE